MVDHLPCAFPDSQENTRKIRVQNTLELIERHLPDHFPGILVRIEHQTVSGNTCTGHNQVNFAKDLDRFFCKPDAIGFVYNVAGNRDRLAPQTFQGLFRLFETILRYICQNYLPSANHPVFAERPPNSLSSPRNDRHGTPDIEHGSPFWK